jgi:Phage tail tube protein
MPSVPGGLGVQVGFGTESRYGTFVAPTTFIKPEEGLSIDAEQQYQRYGGLGGNQLMQEDGLHVLTTRDGRLSIPAVLRDNGFGRLLNLLHGETVTPASLTGGIYRQTHNIGRSAPVGKSLTAQVGVPQKDGTVRAFSFVGSKVTSATLALDVEGSVTSTWEMDARDVDTGQALATATYPSGSKPFVGVTTGSSIEFDDIIVADCIRSWSLTLPIPQKLDDRCIGTGPLKSEPTPNGRIEPSLTLEMQFQSLTEFTAFQAARRRKIRLIAAGSNTSGTFGTGLYITIANAVPVQSGPRINGLDLITQTVQFDVTDAGGVAYPLVIDYLTRDATL